MRASRVVTVASNSECIFNAARRRAAENSSGTGRVLGVVAEVDPAKPRRVQLGHNNPVHKAHGCTRLPACGIIFCTRLLHALTRREVVRVHGGPPPTRLTFHNANRRRGGVSRSVDTARES